MNTDLQKLRQEYRLRSLDDAGVHTDPFEQFKIWFSEALSSQLAEPNAMILATVSSAGEPSARTVLLKEYDTRGFVFYTNYNSRKGRDLVANPKAALLFYWAELERQIRIEGIVERVPRIQSENYFRMRPHGAQIGTLASAQSAVVRSRADLEAEAARLEKLWQGKEIPCPPDWGGYLLHPQSYEFWQGRENRLHDRIRYQMQGESWKIQRLAP